MPLSHRPSAFKVIQRLAHLMRTQAEHEHAGHSLLAHALEPARDLSSACSLTDTYASMAGPAALTWPHTDTACDLLSTVCRPEWAFVLHMIRWRLDTSRSITTKHQLHLLMLSAIIDIETACPEE